MNIEEYKRMLTNISNILPNFNCKNIYDFILNFSNIKMEDPNITENQIKEMPLEKLRKILDETYKYYMDIIKQYPEQSFAPRVVSAAIFSMRILSDDKYKKMYDGPCDCNYIESVNDIKDLSVENLKAISKGLDFMNNKTLIDTIPLTDGDIEFYNDIKSQKHRL